MPTDRLACCFRPKPPYLRLLSHDPNRGRSIVWLLIVECRSHVRCFGRPVSASGASSRLGCRQVRHQTCCSHRVRVLGSDFDFASAGSPRGARIRSYSTRLFFRFVVLAWPYLDRPASSKPRTWFRNTTRLTPSFWENKDRMRSAMDSTRFSFVLD